MRLRTLTGGLLLLGACTAPDYTGTYVANHPYGPDTLVLNADSTYVHRFYSKEGPVYKHTGKWSAWSLKEFNRLDIQNFDWHIPGHGAPAGRGAANTSWPVEPERTLLNEQVLTIDQDMGYYYEKIK